MLCMGTLLSTLNPEAKICVYNTIVYIQQSVHMSHDVGFVFAAMNCNERKDRRLNREAWDPPVSLHRIGDAGQGQLLYSVYHNTDFKKKI